MDIDFEKIFKEDKNSVGEKKKNVSRVGNVIPGFFFVFVFVIPVFIIYSIFPHPLIDFFRENNLIEINIGLYLFFVAALVVSILLEIKQPFSVTSIRQPKKGGVIRKAALIVVALYVGIIIFGGILIFQDLNKYIDIYEGFYPISDLLWFLK